MVVSSSPILKNAQKPPHIASAGVSVDSFTPPPPSTNRGHGHEYRERQCATPAGRYA